MTSMRDFELIALNLPGSIDPAVAIAASRAGAIGVLDLEDARDEAAALVAVARMAELADGRCGLKLDCRRERHAFLCDAGLPPQLEVLMLTPRGPDELAAAVAEFRPRVGRIFVEAVCEEEALAAVAAGADGIIAKGHEAGGRVGDETTFILLQRLIAWAELPVWAHGGIGIHTAAACYAAGAAGIVLDAQLALARETVLAHEARDAIERMDGSETTLVGDGRGARYRVYHRAGPLPTSPEHDGSVVVGQDAAFAAELTRRYRTVGGILGAFADGIGRHVAAAKALRQLDEGSPLARSHGTRYPIVQGPMTRVSDQPRFAARVAEAGGLPFLALALMRGGELEELLEETRRQLRDRPWGIGILGFVPGDLREEQLELAAKIRPTFALIAGGRPDQALTLERLGIPTYLHVPSPRLLSLFLEAGARRFVFEGRECGGHVGPRSSFVLWNTMIDVLLESVAPVELADCHVLFAGGIHDALSSAMVAAAAAPLAEAGARIGVLVGTAYVFTRDAVETGAVVEGFQQEALACRRTALLETGPGHATRCVDTAYVEAFAREKERLLAEGVPAQDLREALERLNLGRLRVASKGLARPAQHPNHGHDPSAPRLVRLPREEQRTAGMYMIGQAAALRDATCTVEELHDDVSRGATEHIAAVETPPPRQAKRPARPADVAIVGMSCILPKAPDVETYWQNVLAGVDAITEVPPERWDWRRYFDEDPSALDKVYSRWGGFLDDVVFDPVRYGMPPSSLPSIEPLQLLTLELVRAALDDAGYADAGEADPAFPRESTSVILGVGGGVADLGQQYAVRSGLPMFVGNVSPETLARLPEWTEDSFAGILLNVAAGRVANRFDLGGVNYTVDAACASSLAAVYLGVRELVTGESDIVIAGGADTVQNPFGYLCFSKTHALSPRGRCRPFDAMADGIVISEGLAALVLKRLADAERDGDRIYAVVKAVAGSSDGRAKGLTAPRPEGQQLALRRAYEQAGVSPASVGLVEAHGTGTVAGDRAEVETLKTVFAAAGAEPASCAIGSVKSMIGHTKCTAGVAGLMKAALSLHEAILPPTINVDRPADAVVAADSPFYVNTESRPWLDGHGDTPRRAAVSAFGFGGTNFHAVLEEYTRAPDAAAWTVARDRPAELFVVGGDSRSELLHAVERVDRALAGGADPALRNVSYTLWQQAASAPGNALRLALVATSLDDLREKLASARDALAAGSTLVDDPRGVYLVEEPLARNGKIAFLFPGQGSQYLHMLRDLALAFGEVREQFERADEALLDRLPQRLSQYVFPPPAFTADEEQQRTRALTETNVAQPALGAAGLGAFHLLRVLGVSPAAVAGHSYGEYVALCTAGVFDEHTLYVLSEARGRCIVEAVAADGGTMAAVAESEAQVIDLLDGLPDVWVANVNAPRQTVISGTRTGVDTAIERLTAAGVEARPLPVACAFHSPLVARARDRFADVLAGVELAPPHLTAYSNTTGAPHPRDPEAIRELLAEHLVRPVRFADEVERMYADGVRVFVEAGPRGVLTGLASQVLAERPHAAAATDAPGRPGIVQLRHALARLATHGVPVQLDRLYRGRDPRQLDLESLAPPAPRPPTAWLVNGGRARPLHDPEPVRTAPAEPAGPAPSRISADAAFAPAVPGRALDDGDDAARVVLRFQMLMDRFLETQQEVLLGYLGGNGGAEPPALAAAPEGPTASVEQPATEPEPTAPAPEPELHGSSAAPDLLETLLRLVGERTGYPAEMLDPDLDIESELGIDSIKRVEILGALQGEIADVDGQATSALMERLTGLKSLRAIADAVRASVRSNGVEPIAIAPPGEPAEPQPDPDADPVVELPRFTLHAVPAPPADSPCELSSEDVFLVTRDDGGVADALAEELRSRGVRVTLVGAETPFADPAAAGELVNRVRRDLGAISGVVHLLPLAGGSGFDELDLEGLRVRLDRDVRGLFALAQAVGGDLRQAAAAGRPAWLVAATALGGAFGSEGCAEVAGAPTHGAVAGLVKTLAAEWPEVRCKVVDLDPAEPPAGRAASMLAELSLADGEPEVGWRRGERVVLRPRPAPLSRSPETVAPLERGSVVLVTGGGRGVTAEIVRELARRYQPTVLLVGRSPVTDADEPPDTRHLASAAELRTALVERARRVDARRTPREIEAECRAILNARELRATLTAVAEAGAEAAYFQTDVRDPDAFGRLLDEIYERYGRIDGVVHGAGVIEDRLLLDKTPASFDRVLETKVLSTFVLAQKLRPDSLRFLLLFSSVAGRFGNAGQSDYAAANEFLNKVALHLDSRWPGRVCALNWGPWHATGMVSPELRRRFEARGVRLIEVETGRRALVHELEHGRKGEAEVILGDGPWAVAPRADGAALALLDGVEPGSTSDGRLAATWTLDPDRDPFLRDHRLDGHAVLPAAVALELVAEAAQRSRPDREVVEVRDLRVLKGVVLDGAPATLEVVTEPRQAQGMEEPEVDGTIAAPDGGGGPSYRATVVLASAATPPLQSLPPLTDLRPLPLSLEEAYEQWLFQGPLFQGIEEVVGIGDDGIEATLVPCSPDRAVRGTRATSWIIDPIVVDSAFQLAILWARATSEMTPLPAGFRRFRRFAPLTGDRVRCSFYARSSVGGHILDSDIAFLAPDGRLLGLIENMEFACTRALNRLAAGVAG
jgi:acyl transferase domain-containing protein/NAD(P)H-dependent flavin oxidoreductase YrpB (nitropropane dioxygenase family)/NAD(P)-dependent dehydrogenase (short-subunit alcohol dehydrogenase family)